MGDLNPPPCWDEIFLKQKEEPEARNVFIFHV
jgi:hypothetical protein